MKNFAADTCGATAIEYALIASLISVLIITGLTAVGTKTSSMFNLVSSSLK